MSSFNLTPSTIRVELSDSPDIIKYKWARAFGVPIDYVLTIAENKYTTYHIVLRDANLDFEAAYTQLLPFLTDRRRTTDFVRVYLYTYYNNHDVMPNLKDLERTIQAYDAGFTIDRIGYGKTEDIILDWKEKIDDEVSAITRELTDKINHVPTNKVDKRDLYVERIRLNMTINTQGYSAWEVFDKTTLSDDMYHIVYGKDEIFCTKIWNTPDTKDIINYPRINDDEVIYTVLDKFTVELNFTKSVADMFYTYESPVLYTDILVSELTNKATRLISFAFPTIMISGAAIRDYYGNITLVNAKVKAYVLAHNLLNVEYFRSSMYIDEEGKPLAEKLGVNVHYGTTKSIGSARLMQQGNDVFISMSRIDNLPVLNTFIDRLQRLVAISCVSDETYTTNIDNLDQFYTSLEGGSVETKDVVRHVTDLKKRAPHIFAGLYTSVCKKERRPNIHELDEVVDFNALEYKGFKFTCPNKEYPYPILSNDIYPCCSKNPKAVTAIDRSEEKTLGIVSVIRQLEYRVTAEYSNSFSTLVKNYLGIPKLYRTGCEPSSKSSMLFAIFMSKITKHSDNFLNAYPDKNLRMDAVNELRANMIANIGMPFYAEVMRQEMPNNENALKQLLDPDVFLDHALFFRAIEVIFNINIYVLDIDGNFILPHYERLYIKTFNKKQRSLVLIKRDRIRGGALLEFPHYELMGYETPSGEIAYTFSGVGATFIQNTLLNANQVVLWTNYGANANSNVDNITTKRFNTFSRINIEDIFGSYVIESQYIDTLGKLRAIQISAGGIQQVVFVPPNQPLNVPLMPIGKTNVNSEQVVENILGGRSMITAKDTGKRKGYAVGLWVVVGDINYGLYFPIKPTKTEWVMALPDGPGVPFVMSETSNRFHDVLYNIVSARDDLLHVIRWLADIYRKGSKNPDAKMFLRAIIHTAPNENIKEFMFFTQRPKELPDVDTLAAAFEFLSGTSPFVVNKKLQFDSDSLYTSLVGYTTVYYKNHDSKHKTTLSMTSRPGIEIEYKQPGVTFLRDFNQFLLWSASQYAAFSYQSKFPKSIELYSSHIVRDASGNFYLIQTLEEPTDRRAISFMQVYAQTGHNLGPYIRYNNQLSQAEVEQILSTYPVTESPNNSPLSLLKNVSGISILIPL